MYICTILWACFVLFVGCATSDEDVDIKRGTFPFMALVYYPDYVEVINAKFTRSAVLIRENWLITSSFDNQDAPIPFPEKTLLARLGAISIDSNFTLNEDENEQEREIIQIIRPYYSNFTEWWSRDVSLLKTLLPFNMTSAVATITTYPDKLDFVENCFILIYAKRNVSLIEERILTKMAVDLLPSSMENCGGNFRNETMICASRSEEKSYKFDSDFCLENSGGPLICNNNLVGIQTYVNDCKEPYLYQLIKAWNDLITCATDEKCQEDQCSKICLSINKDLLTNDTTKIIVTEESIVNLADGYLSENTTKKNIIPTFISIVEINENESNKMVLTSSNTVDNQIITTSAVSTSVMDTTSSFEETSVITSTDPTLSSSLEVNDNSADVSPEYTEERGRKANVEAQQHSRATSNIPRLFNCSVIVLVTLACLI